MTILTITGFMAIIWLVALSYYIRTLMKPVSYAK